MIQSLFYTLVALLVLNSCITTTNLGGFTNDLGVDKAYRISTTADTPEQNHLKTASPDDFSIYCLDGKYYMEMYYAMAQKETALVRGEDIWGNKGTFIHLWKTDKERLKKLTPKPYMVPLNKELVYECLQIRIDEADTDETAIIPKEEFDFSRASRCTPKLTKNTYYHDYYPISHYLPAIPDENGFVHYALQPISWPLKVVDAVPSSLAWGTLWLIASPYILKEQIQLMSNRPINHPKLGDGSERIP